ncbi:hypothetical protein [Mycobacteroides saopaulense]|uniref:ESX secretion-associated protein EspG n=1 Tax=Mycobacteroides saopaulense TaxID=1578165 RepID=A0ABX3BWF1_9MYCO|nr:hypothetical protein [Mycobacteroides saopaulense]OHT81182.1 hypothetical protein BKG68_23355 [Mycobacteroides saopaulense]OHU07331.1 hypothetical protein BKG73_18960 [Mycobacteroides saopaulense]
MITGDLAPLRYDVESWNMSGFDFRCTCEALGFDQLPFPLGYRNRQIYMDEVESDRIIALDRQRAGMNQYRVYILEALRHPALIVRGFGRINRGPSEKLYRLFGTIGTNAYGAVITQDPSDEPLFGSDVQVRGCANVDFPQTVIRALPEFRPGRRARQDIPHKSDSLSKLFQGLRVSSSVLLSVSVDFSLDYELRDPVHLTLVNIADDGAYIVNENPDVIQVVPATIPNLMKTFRAIEAIQSNAAQKLAAHERTD